MWPFILSDRLPIVALVSRYPTNQLIGRRPILQRCLRAPFKLPSCGRSFVSGISIPFGMLSPSEGQVAYALLTRSPLGILPKQNSPFDLHVLSTPPAFVLSQDQTLHKSFMEKPIWLFFVVSKLYDLVHLRCRKWDPHIYLVSCYSVFKVPLSCDSLYSLHHFFDDVNYFFRIFYFRRSRRACRKHPAKRLLSHAANVYYHFQTGLSSPFPTFF